MDEALLKRLKEIRLVALDVDGVLTDGGIYYGNQGEELKRFYVQDGLGIRLMLDAGIHVGLITARQSQLVARRGAELKMSFVHQGVKEKWGCLREEMTRLGVEPSQCAYMGDDLIDLSILTRVGVSTTPADGHMAVQERVDWVAPKPGGAGAVRALSDVVLQTQGVWDTIMARMIG
ncbi:KdsC family phosphatase [Magnetococcus sp. PR-3]|uniref:KdsC family phosphatase n=1 Tax=Magnetococcus sp. PR-3 TaxID=3120355 RepID=UPI002FCE1EB8